MSIHDDQSARTSDAVSLNDVEFLADALAEADSYGPLSINETIDDVLGWSKWLHSDAWKRNKRGLISDFFWSVEDVGPTVRELIGPAERSFGRLISDDSMTAAEFKTALSDLRDVVASKEAIAAAWRDIRVSVSDFEIEPTYVARLTRTLRGCLSANGINASDRVRDMILCLRGQGRFVVERRDGNEAESGPVSARSRLEDAETTLFRGPFLSNCVVWLRYDHAKIEQPFSTVGRVMMVNSAWCLNGPSQVSDREFPYRAELESVMLHDRGYKWANENADTAPTVIARVDLGLMHRGSAVESAEYEISSVLAIANAFSSGIWWKRSGPATVLADGKQVSWSHKIGDRHGFVDMMGIDQTASTLSEWIPPLNDALRERPMPPPLREALRLISDAGLESSRESSLGAARRLHERTAIMLRAQAFEHVASHAEVAADDLSANLLGYWPDSIWRSEIANLVEPMLRYSHFQPGASELLIRLRHDGSTDSLNLAAVVRAERELVEYATGRFEINRLQKLLRLAQNGPAYLEMSQQLSSTLRSVDERHRRVRNALAHGNPITNAAITSVARFSAERANTAVAASLRAFASGADLVADLRRTQEEREEHDADLKAGSSWLHIWDSA